MAIIKEAMVLAAGLGTRMRPLTDTIPKPMIEIRGRTMIDRALDKLVEAGVERAVINTFYLPEIIEKHLAKRKDIEIIFSREEERLETGGGILKALPLFKSNPIYIVSTDIMWEGEGLKQLADGWNDKLVGLLLLHKAKGAFGYDGKGDFDLQGRKISWRKENTDAEYVFTGLQILCLNIFKKDDMKALGNVFPINKIYSLYLNGYRGVVNNGEWYHIGTPQVVAEMNA